MLTPPFLCDSPELHSRTPTLRASTPSHGCALPASGDEYDCSRPSIKRQASTPPTTVFTKCTRIASGDEQTLWSDDEVHSAFLEALRNHPPTSTWKSFDAFTDTSNDESADYCRIIQDYILKKTGRPQPFEHISERLFLAFPSPQTTPTTPFFPDESESKPHITVQESEPEISGYKPSYISQLHGGSIPDAATFDCALIRPAGMRARESSMSKRRQASNRPILNLHVDIPSSYSLDRADATLISEFRSESSGLTPSIASSRPFSTPEGTTNPTTPLDKCHKGPLVPPEIPRLANIHRSGRWVPTPTEGVIPSLSYISAASTPSPASESSSSSSGSNSAQSSSTVRARAPRPSMSNRQLSWLSLPKHSTSDNSEFSALASPIPSLIGLNEPAISSPLAQCDAF